MKAETFSPRRSGFSKVDLLVILVTVAMVVMLILPAIAKRKARGGHVSCGGMLKQIGLSVRLWSNDNGGRPPFQVSTNQGGANEFIESGSVAKYFQVMSNELGTPRILVCWTDRQRTAATNFTSLQNANISYFVVPEAGETKPEMWLSGDRNLATNTVPLNPGLFTVPTNHVMGWTSQMHQDTGNLVLADGSVRGPSSRMLHQSATKALRAYYLATTNASFRIAIP